MPQSDLWGFINEVKKACEEADTKRLSVMWPDFQAEFPELVEEIFFCAKMQSAEIVKKYLIQRDPRFMGLLLVPNVDRVIEFLMRFINERGVENAAIPVPIGVADDSRAFRNRSHRHSSDA